MSHTFTVPGQAFRPQFPGGTSIILDLMGLNFESAARTSGVTRVGPLQIQPNLGRARLIGWALTLRVAIRKGTAANIGGRSPMAYMKFGTLLAGITLNAGLNDLTAATLPSDFTTFTEVWDPNQDCGPTLSSTSDNPLDYKPIGVIYMLPAPILIQTEEQLQFVLIMTPSAGGQATANVTGVGPQVRFAQYTLIYETVK